MPNLSELLYYTGETSTQLIVWSLFIGVIAAALAGYFIKIKFGTFIRKLLENEIDTPEKAVTLEELGLQKKLFIKLGLKSHTNYKNMLVAITEDGKYYANNTYTTKAPAFKEFIIVKRKRASSAIKETENSDESVPLSGLAKILQSKEKAVQEKNNEHKTADGNTDANTLETISVSSAVAQDDHATKKEDSADIEKSEPETLIASSNNENSASDEVSGARFSDTPKERVKFDVKKARYYIPPEIHDRAYSLYHAKSGKSNTFIQIVLILIVLGLIATASGSLISGFTDFIGGFENPFKKPTI